MTNVSFFKANAGLIQTLYKPQTGQVLANNGRMQAVAGWGVALGSAAPEGLPTAGGTRTVWRAMLLFFRTMMTLS